MYNILVVDDEAMIRNIIKKYASFEGHYVSEAKNGMEAIEMVEKNLYDIIILDIMMPELDGFSTLKHIRQISSTPVIMLSARGEEYDKIHGFELGIDDYVVKPFSPRELLLRIDAIIKRSTSKNFDTKTSVYMVGTLKADFTGHNVYVDDERITLSPKEYDLLIYLIKNENIALTRENLIEKVWGYAFFGDNRTLDTHIKLLRKKLKDNAKYIETVRSVGYKFETKA